MKKMRIYISVAMIVATFCVSQISRADILEPASKARKTISLNGTWKYSADDEKEYSKADYDDSGWKDVKVPVDWKHGEKGGAGWYRKSFTVQKNYTYEWLQFEQILDEGEVWLNGIHLINPKFQQPLEDRQLGVYAHVWPFRWSEVFQAGNLIRPGSRNVIAVRVTDDPARGTRQIDNHEEPTFKGVSGITGDVLLIGHSEVFIRAFQRVSPKTLENDKKCRHIFRAVLANSGIGKRECTIKMTIYKASGGVLYEKTDTTQIDSSGGVMEFVWKTDPSYETYRATLHIYDEANRLDEVSLVFNGTFVQSSGAELYVNGLPYRIRGIQGIPGLLVSGNVKTTTYKAAWARDELRRLADIGVNTVRTENPPLSLVEEAGKQGIMIVPIITANPARTVLALREYGNILYWDITSANRQEIPGMLKAINSLDSYRRPISYSGPLDIDTSDRSFAGVKIRGYQSSSKDDGICGAQDGGTKNGLTAVLVNWGAAASVRDNYEALRAAPDLTRSWTSCVEAGKVRGAFYANISEADKDIPPLRSPNTLKWKPFLSEILANLYRDFSAYFIKASSGGYATDLTFNGAARADDVNVRISNKKQILAKRDSLFRGQSVRVDFPRNEGSIPDLTLEFTTNNGIPRSYDLDFKTPVQKPDAGYITIKPSVLTRNRESQIRVIVNGGYIPRTADISISTSDPSVSVKPAKRGVSIPANNDVSVPFSVVASKSNMTFLITATVKYTDMPSPPLNIYLPVSVD